MVFFRGASIVSFLTIAGSFLSQTAQAIPRPHDNRSRGYDYGVDIGALLKRDVAPMPTTGVSFNSSNSSIPVRQEIRDLQKNADLWELYILGVSMMQTINQSDIRSWYQIAGIHGRPYLPYDGVQASPGDENNGYCTHVSILFPTWHRPYLALYEQVLHSVVVFIAAQFPAGAERNRYTAAAANFRIPYWDWAVVPPTGESVLPPSVSTPTVTVNGPAGVQTISNPLFSYHFNPLDPSELPDAPFSQFPQTLRYPTSNDASATSQNSLVAKQLDNSAASFRNRLYNLFTNYHDYSTFSNEAWITASSPGDFDSIESLHDQIHGLAGSGGHMSYIDYSSFDPLFFLHHTMIDRCFAIWQTLNPDSYVTPREASYSTFTMTAGTTQDVSTPLKPFYNADGNNFYTSSDVISTESFGYAYPETLQGGNTTAQAIKAINLLYGTTAPAKTVSRGLFPGLASKLLGREHQLNSTYDLLSFALAPNGQYTEWIANIQVEKFALSRSFFIHVFLGPFNDDPRVVGTHCVFAKLSSSGASAADPNQLVTGTIPLTSALLEDISEGHLRSLNDVDVEPYLRKNLQYRITLLNDTEIDNSAVPSLKLSVVSSSVQQSTADHELPKWGSMISRLELFAEELKEALGNTTLKGY
ncbi:putative tyrosinase protein [Botrytis fragariae]|uniref:Putative tyrosinase protein n=1 Tax=Botrytis fragariae TaxID=1964551 RepID=A0A8H6AXV0_9HELO|nr:putative tyrosinase protein [Botrytis fragariae]KAF5875638.1 putative tyrosinase protein [Botrytis fragariae]